MGHRSSKAVRRTPKRARPRGRHPIIDLSRITLNPRGLALRDIKQHLEKRETAGQTEPDVPPVKPTTPARADVRFEDTSSLFDRRAVIDQWSSRRSEYIKVFTDLAVDHLALSSALDSLAAEMPILTDNAASLSVKELQVTLSGVFSVAYVEKLCTLLALPERARASMIDAINDRTWRPRPPAPVTINNSSAPPAKRQSSAASDGTPRTIAFDPKESRVIPSMPSPYGITF